MTRLNDLTDIKTKASIVARLLTRYYGVKTIGQIVNEYRDRLTDIVYAAFKSGDAVDMRRAHKALIRALAGEVYDEGLREGGMNPEDMDDEQRSDRDEAVTDWIASQLDYVNQFAKDTVAARRDKPAQQVIIQRVDLWVDSFRNFGEAGKTAALGNIMLTFDGDDGEESCDDCQRYKGQRHTRNWWAARGLLERNGNINYECGRWANCHHSFYNAAGEIIVS